MNNLFGWLRIPDDKLLSKGWRLWKRTESGATYYALTIDSSTIDDNPLAENPPDTDKGYMSLNLLLRSVGIIL